MSTAEKEQIHSRGIISGIEVRDIDEDNRTASFVAATENGVDTFWGKEYLRMSGVRLQRFRKNPVILDSHNRFNAADIIGKAAVKKVGRELIADITFAKTARAEEVWQLVRDGFINAVSVGFIPTRAKIADLREGETDGEGDSMITGPARVIREWELFEISIVPVPADPDAVRRAFMDGQEVGLQAAYERLMPQPKESTEMADTTPEKPEESRAAETAQTPAQVPENEAEQIARTIKAQAEAIRAITPRGCEAEAERLITKGATLEEARAALLEALEKRSAAVGTPEATTQTAGETEAVKVADVSGDDLVRALRF